MQVVDLMTSEVVSVAPETPIREAARLMFRHKVSGLPVVDEARCLVGIVTEADFLRMEVAQADAEEASTPGTVRDLMSSSVIAVAPEASITDAARLMVSNDVKRLPVVDHDDQMIGIVSRLDVVAVFARPDDVIEDEISEDVLRRVLFVDPDDIDVKVVDGVATFDGVIGTRNEARLLGELVRRLDGVIDVHNRLSWRVDDTES